MTLRIGALLLAAGALLSARTAVQPFELTVDAPAALAETARRVEATSPFSLADSLARAGLHLPPRVQVTLIDENDPRAAHVPAWVIGRAFGTDTIVLFPGRVRAYPYESLESLVLHEIVHLALASGAAGRPLPRWFHEGVAVSVEAGWGIGSQARLLLAAASDPAIEDVNALFASDSVPETTTAYLLAAALVEDVRRRHGLAVPGAVAARVGRGEPFDRAFTAETGETVGEAAAQAWTVYRGLRWLPILASNAGSWGLILLLAFVAFIVRLVRRRQRRRQWDEEDDEEESPDEDPPDEPDRDVGGLA